MQRTIKGGTRGETPLYCPKCGSELSAKLLVIEDEAEQETVLCLDCPRGDFHTAITQKDVAEAITQKVMERLR